MSSLARDLAPADAGRDAAATPRGFTLLELVVAMGLLSAFLAMLVQVLDTGVGIFDAGERGQDLSDRAQAASRAVRTALGSMVGPTRASFEDGYPDARLLVDWSASGFDVENGAATEIQVLRSTVRLSPAEEERLLADYLLPTAEEQVGGQGAQAIDRRVGELVATYPRRERGEMLLLPWPADADGVFFELRRGLLIDDPALLADSADRLVEADELGGLDPERVIALTDVVATGLLHIEFQFWSQHTRSWDAAPGGAGPELVWDSARAGLLLGDDGARYTFSLDVGPGSLRDARDDVFPGWVRVILVVDRGPNHAPDAFLTEPLGRDDKTMVLSRTDRLPDPGQTHYLKVGPEWVRAGSFGSRRVTGLARGQRGTSATAHEAGTSVRAGREIVIPLKLAHGRDSDG